MPEFTGDTTGLGTTRLLEAIRRSGIKTRFYQASSSEMFGSTPPPQNEKSPFHPRSPYGAAKVYAYWMAVNYREAYKIFTSNGVLFNHESPRRGKPLSLAKSPAASLRFSPEDRRKYIWETLTQSGTGAMRPSMWKRCGASSNWRNPGSLSWVQVKNIPSKNSPMRPSATHLRQPLSQLLRHELRAVVRTNVFRDSPEQHHIC
jgi:hypothetical protein